MKAVLIMTNDVYIDIQNISYQYPGRKERAVNNISLQIFRGEKVAITGLNGSGKSTLAKLIMGLLKANGGCITVDDKRVEDYSLSEIGEKLGYIFPNPNRMFFNTSVYREIAYGLRWRGFGKEEAEAVCSHYLQYFDLWNIKDALPFNLSEGQKQLVAILSILVLKPDFLILDEPTKNIDNYRKKNLQLVLQNIWEKGTGLVIISHDQEFTKRMGGRQVHMAKGELSLE